MLPRSIEFFDILREIQNKLLNNFNKNKTLGVYSNSLHSRPAWPEVFGQ